MSTVTGPGGTSADAPGGTTAGTAAGPVCALADLAQRRPRPVRVGDVDVVLVRDGDEVFALRDECSHAEVALSEGDVQATRSGGLRVECWLHGSCFDLRTGQPSGLPATEPVDTFTTRVVDGAVYVDTGPPADR